MNRLFPLSEARRNLSELVHEAYHEGKLFGISKGKKPMGVLIGTREWREVIDTIEMHDHGLADTLAIMADPDLQRLLEEGDENIKKGNVIPWEHVISEAGDET